MKTEYKNPMLEVIKLSSFDIVTASGCVGANKCPDDFSGGGGTGGTGQQGCGEN